MLKNIFKNKTVINLFIFIIILIIAYISFKIYKKEKEKADKKKKADDIKAENAENLQNAVNSHVADAGGNIIGEVSTYNKIELKQMADSLYSAMKGYGTDEQTILSVLGALRTKADWVGVFKAFNIKKGAYGSTFKGNLSFWLSDELGGSDKARANSLLSKFNVRI